MLRWICHISLSEGDAPRSRNISFVKQEEIITIQMVFHRLDRWFCNRKGRILFPWFCLQQVTSRYRTQWFHGRTDTARGTGGWGLLYKRSNSLFASYSIIVFINRDNTRLLNSTVFVRNIPDKTRNWNFLLMTYYSCFLWPPLPPPRHKIWGKLEVQVP